VPALVGAAAAVCTANGALGVAERMRDQAAALAQALGVDEAQRVAAHETAGLRAALAKAAAETGRVFPTGRPHPYCLTLRTELASALEDLSEIEEATALQREACASLHDVLGEGDVTTILAHHSLASLLLKMRQTDEAIELLNETLAAAKATCGERHAESLRLMAKLGSALMRKKELETARPLLIEVLEAKRELLGNLDPETLAAMASVGMLYKEQGELQAAREVFHEAVNGALVTLGEEHPKTRSHQRWLARVEELGDRLAN
jgi:tetratricopeptide (TPR) repeat protein